MNTGNLWRLLGRVPLGVSRRMESRLRHLRLRMMDSKRIAELAGERVVFHRLKSRGYLDGLQGKRILEIGPKHGQDSRLLAGLGCSELVLLDLPEKTPIVETWLPEVESICRTVLVKGNILYLKPHELHGLGLFELVWCTGVLYHNVEQIRLLRTLFNLCAHNGRVIIESATTRNKQLAALNVVEIHWPSTYRGVQTITHLPSRLAIRSWMEMVGFSEVSLHDLYSRELRWQRTVLTGRRRPGEASYLSYAASGCNPPYLAGEAE